MAVGSNNERLFPTLSEAQMNRIAAHGRRRQTTKGEVLTEVGEIAPLFVVVRGTLEVLRRALLQSESRPRGGVPEVSEGGVVIGYREDVRIVVVRL